MTKLAWNAPGARKFETGVSNGVLYPKIGKGVSWNGLLSFKNSSIGGEPVPYYLDGVKYLNYSSGEEFVGALDAYTYPEEFEECEGIYKNSKGLYLFEQKRKMFGFSYQTKIGNDISGDDEGYKIHLIYNALVAPSGKDYASVGEDMSPSVFSWAISTIPIIIPGHAPTAHLAVLSTKTNYYLLRAIEDILYGSANTEPRMPSANELYQIFVNSPDSLQINPDTLSGLSNLVVDDYSADLIGKQNEGKYQATFDTRLEETASLGLFRLNP